MSVAINTVNISGLIPSPKAIEENVIVGKDILDLLAGSMYVDPMDVYREYIQNAADSIDQARDKGLEFEQPPGVQIFIDHAERSVRIRDNGISIPFSEFVQRTLTIGASQKKGQQLRGFRGVGRLSGLGYCQELVFRGRAEGNAKVTEVRWNGRALKEKYRDPNHEGTLADIVKEVTTVTHLSPQGYPGRFFEVELRKVARLKNDLLLNEEVIRNYLSQVAPVPFGNSQYAGHITNWLETHGVRPPINIEIMDESGPIFHRLNDSIKFSDQVQDPIQGVEYFELMGSDGEVCACGWIAQHSYLGSIPKRLGLGGLRVRVGNIQVGSEAIASMLFPEPRFSGWAIGDIHVLSPKILPNGRRDEFEPSTAYVHLQSEMIIKAREISQRIREYSAKRNKLRSVKQKIVTVNTWVGLDSDQQLPTLIREILLDLSKEHLGHAVKEFARLDDGTPEAMSTKELLTQIEISAHSVLTRNIKDNAQRTMSEDLKKPIGAALKTIIATAKTPDAGIKLSLEVLEAIQKEI